MEKLYSPAVINRIREKHDFHFAKGLGQNFLTDGNIVENIVEGAQVGTGDLVIEIGPGMGVLTAAAAERAAAVYAVEIDRNLIPILKETLKDYPNVTVIHGDIMKTQLGELIQKARAGNPDKFSGVKVIGNLPYYITTPIIMKVLEEKGGGETFDSLTFMMQKEVAERIRANPGSKIYGAISVAVQYYCKTDLVAVAPKEVFLPRPKVDSAVLRLTLRDEPPVTLLSEPMFFAAVRAGFGQRRKTLQNALTGLCGVDKQQAGELLSQAGVDPGKRAETLSLDQFAAIANAWALRG